jgi:glycosidase
LVSTDSKLQLDPHTLRILFGNEPIPISTGTESQQADHSASAALPVDWIDEDRFVIRGLRDLAAYRSSDCRLRLFGRTRDGQWVESSFPFGGELRRLFDPHDAVLYVGLTDRLADGEPELNAPLLSSGAPPPSLDDWQGGDTAGLVHLIQSGYFTTLGANTLVLSPPYRQADSAISLPAGPSSSPQNVAPYRGLAPLSFAESEPRFGSLDNWAQAIHEAHLVGLSVLFQYCPLLVHETSSLVKEDPDWFAEEDHELKTSRAAAEQINLNRAEYFAPSLRILRLTRENTDAVERMTGYGLFWLRVLNSDGLQCLASDEVPGAFWKRLSRRVREEIARPEGRGVYLLGEPLDAQRLPYDDADADLGSLEGGVDLSLALSLRSALAKRESSLRKLDRAVRDTVRLQGLGFLPCAVSGNADLPRLLSVAKDSSANPSLDSEAGRDAIHRLFFTALLTLPAVPGIYYGDEIGLSGATVPENRSMLPARGGRTGAQRERYHTVASLTSLRAAHPALRRGSYQPLLVEDDLLVFGRAAWKEVIVVALNRGDKPAVAEFTVPANLKSALTLKPLHDPDGQTVYLRNGRANIELPPLSAHIWIAR